MNEREAAVRLWFQMWLTGEGDGILDLFTPDAVYIESWGPEYHGAARIRHWFCEWNTRGRVLRWEIRRFWHQGDRTAVEWFFDAAMADGTRTAFEGVSLIDWDGARIARLQEFGCNTDRYDPYAAGPVPRFRDEAARWF